MRQSERRSAQTGALCMLLLAAGFGLYAHDMWRENGMHQMIFAGIGALVSVALSAACAAYWLMEPRRRRFVVEMKLRHTAPEGNMVWATYDVVRCQQLTANGLGPQTSPPRAVVERLFESTDSIPDRYLEVRGDKGESLQSVPDLLLPPLAP